MSNYSGKELIDALYNEFLSISDFIIADINKAYSYYKTKYFFDNKLGVLKGLLFKIKMILYENIDSYRELIERIQKETDEDELKKLINTDIYYIEIILQSTKFIQDDYKLNEMLKKYLYSLKHFDDDKNYKLRKYMIEKLNSIRFATKTDVNLNKNYDGEYNLIWDKISENNYLKIKYGL